ncbi:MAG: hypothetical protein ACRDHW_00835 [Ktedonobacteraceae bacterium]
MQPSIPQDAAFLLPLIAAGLTHYLVSDRLAPWKNAIIALIFLVATALACAWLSGTFLLSSPQASVLAILAYVVVLMNGSLRTILLYLESIPSPFDGPAPVNANPITGVGTKAAVPTAIQLPASAPSQEPPK